MAFIDVDCLSLLAIFCSMIWSLLLLSVTKENLIENWECDESTVASADKFVVETIKESNISIYRRCLTSCVTIRASSIFGIISKESGTLFKRSITGISIPIKRFLIFIKIKSDNSVTLVLSIDTKEIQESNWTLKTRFSNDRNLCTGLEKIASVVLVHTERNFFKNMFTIRQLLSCATGDFEPVNFLSVACVLAPHRFEIWGTDWWVSVENSI